MLCPQCGKSVGDKSQLCESCEAQRAEAAKNPPVVEKAKKEAAVEAEVSEEEERPEPNLIRDFFAKVVQQEILFFAVVGVFFFLMLVYFVLVLADQSLLKPIGISLILSAGFAFAVELFSPEEPFDRLALRKTAKYLGVAGLASFLVGMLH